MPAGATKFTEVDLLFSFSKTSSRRHLASGPSSSSVWTATFGRSLCHGNGDAVVLPERVAFAVTRYTAASSSTRASTLRGSFSTRSAARRCCWNVEALAFVKSFDADGGAVVLLERRLSPVGRSRHCQPPPRLQLSDGVLRRDRRRKGAAGASASGSWRARTERLSLGPRPLDRVFRRV